MSYILSQIVVFLAIAGFIGLLFGWLLAKYGFDKKAQKIEDLWRLKLIDAKDEFKNEMSFKNQEVADMEEKLKNTKFTYENLLKNKTLRIEELNRDLKSIMKRYQEQEISLNKKVKRLSEDIDDKRTFIDELNKKILTMKKDMVEKDDRYNHLLNKEKSRFANNEKVLKAKLKASDSVIEHIEKNSKKVIEDYENKVVSIAKKLSQIESQAIASNKDWEEKLKNNIKDNEIKRKTMEKSISRLKKELESKKGLEKRLISYKDKFDELEKNVIHEKDKKINIFKMQLEKQDMLYKKLQDELKQYRERVQNLTEEIKKRDDIWKNRIENLLK